MRVVIFGGSGFLARSVARQIQDIEVISITRSALLKTFTSEVNYVWDFQTERHVQDLIYPGDLIIFLAHDFSTANGEDTNLLTNIHLLNTTLKAISKIEIANFIFVSSGGTVYGEAQLSDCWTEEAPLRPISHYGFVKASQEALCHRICVLNNVPYRIMRLANPFGPNYSKRSSLRFIDQVIISLLKNKPIKLYSNNSYVRDFIFVSDFVEAALTIGQITGNSSCTFNVGSSTGRTLDDVINCLCEIGEFDRSKIQIDQCDVRETDVRYNVLNIDRMRDLNWEPKVGFEVGLERTFIHAHERFIGGVL